MIRSGRRIGFALGVVPLFWAGLLAPAVAQSPEAEALEAVRQEIEALERQLARQHVERDSGYRALRAAELEISASAGELDRIRERLDAQQERTRALQRETRAAQDRLATEREALAAQVRASYLAGRQEMLQLLLNQEDPARLGRMMVYYGYLNRARSERVQAVGAQMASLAALVRESERAVEALAALEAAQAGELERLGRARDERRQLIAGIERDIAEAGGEVQRLRDEEQRLADLVAELETLLEGFPVDPEARFGSVRGQLPWPVAGSLISDYGDARGGQLRWNGLVVGAPAGTPVRAVFHGRVAYADWLPGLGLLVILDHGDGYMSLYGHNGVILKESGEWVTPGEAIAQVGDSGGQARNALYFEIRLDGEPLDPGPWLGPRVRP